MGKHLLNTKEQKNTLLQRRIIAFLMVAVMLCNPLFISQTVYGATEIDANCGNVEVTLPSGTDATYTVKLTMSRILSGGDYQSLSVPEEYLATVTFADGSSEPRAVALDVAVWPYLMGSLSDIPAGATVTVENILSTSVDEMVYNNNFRETIITMDVTSSDTSESVVLNNSTQSLTTGETTVFEVNDSGDVSMLQTLTDDTFLNRDDPYASEAGSYDLLYLLNNYNIVSLKDIEATHIIGPIIAQEGAYRTGDTYAGSSSSLPLVASDYSGGVSSYVGQLSALASDASQPGLLLNYDYDFSNNNDFTYPHFYTSATNADGSGYTSVVEVIEYWEAKLNVTLSATGETFRSPNAWGLVDNYTTTGVLQEEKTYTYQNDDFIDFTTMWSDLEAQSVDLLTAGSLEGDRDVIVIYDDVGTRLEVEAGKSYLIKSANALEEVNITLPADYDFFDNPWLPPTTISFDCTTINPAQYGDMIVSQFPLTLINGVQVDTKHGDGGEYGEVGNKIIWNLPNVVTTGTTNRLVTFGNGPNIAGHIVAVNAEFWNISADGYWEGGNLNGTGIFADFHSGEMEMHMWGYNGLTEKATYVNFEVEKTFTHGDLADHSFQFQLTPADDSTQQRLEDLYTFPLTATTNAEGMAYFPSLVFETTGDYAFYVEEVIPEELGTITYDTSRYLVDVSVTAVYHMGDNGDYVTTYQNDITYTLLSDEGNQEAEGLFFTNVQEVPQGATYSFTKVDGNAIPLYGATFTLIDANPAEDESLWETPLDTQISGTDGLVAFEGLQLESTYYFKESSAPEGYLQPTGYWMLAVDGYGVVTVTAMEGAPTITDKKLVNTLVDTPLATVTISKENQHGVGLEGAEFMVERVYSINTHVVVEGLYSAAYVSDAQGEMTISGLPLDGVYRITETLAPDGYTMPFDVNYWLVQVVTDATQEVGYTVTLYAVDIVDDGFNLTVLDNDFTLLNMDVYILPSTGGVGTVWYYTVGLLFVCGGAVLLNTNVRKKKGR